MKAWESGMPDEKMWQQLFDIYKILDAQKVNNEILKLNNFNIYSCNNNLHTKIYKNLNKIY